MTLDFDKGGGRVTVVTRDARTGAVLMVAHADREAMARTESSGEMHYTSRTRGLWRKGETSGNVQRVVRLTADCDGDAVLADVVPAGPACHLGTFSCFREAGEASSALARLDAVVRERAGDASSKGYTRRLLADRNLRLKKLGEEMAEFVTACADGEAARATEEAADVLYHLVVALRALGVGFPEVGAALETRRGEATHPDPPAGP